MRSRQVGHDPIKYALWIGGCSLTLTLICGAYIAWVNGGSRNLALGLGALVGACVIFILQMAFEFKGTKTSSDFAVEFNVDYKTKSVRSPRAFDQATPIAVGYRNVFVEAEASSAIAIAKPALTEDDAPKIASDLGIVSVLAYMLEEQFDWQLDTRFIRTSEGTSTLVSPLSQPSECSSISMDEIREKLRRAGNIFANIAIGMRGSKAALCLPPHSSMEVTSHSVTLSNYVCDISVQLQQPFSSMSSMDPRAVAIARATRQPISTGAELLNDGSARYKTVAIAARTTIEFKALRAQDRNLDKYRNWTERVTNGLRSRFDWPQ